MTNLAQRIETTEDASVAKLKATQNRMICIPQGYDEITELVAIRSLLTLDRAGAAMVRLEILMDRYHGSWRTVA